MRTTTASTKNRRKKSFLVTHWRSKSVSWRKWEIFQWRRSLCLHVMIISHGEREKCSSLLLLLLSYDDDDDDSDWKNLVFFSSHSFSFSIYRIILLTRIGNIIRTGERDWEKGDDGERRSSNRRRRRRKEIWIVRWQAKHRQIESKQKKR